MKTLLDQIKDDYAGEQGRDSWEEYFMWLDLCHTSHSVMQQHYDEIAKRYATEYAKEVQRLCAENASMKVHDGHFKEDSTSKHVQIGANNVQIDKQSILSEDNLPNI